MKARERAIAAIMATCAREAEPMQSTGGACIMTKNEESRENYYAKRKSRREKETTRLMEEVPAFLRENGPTEFTALLAALWATKGRLSQVGRMLEDSGTIHRYRVCPGRDSRRMWSLEPRPPIKPKTEARRIEIGMDRDDLAWMERYRKSAAERIIRAERMARW